MKKYVILVFVTLLAFNINAQSHKDAKSLLDKVKANTQSFNNQKIVFKSTIDSPTGNENSPRMKRKMEGVIYLKGDAYRLVMNELIYINDGQKMYIVDPEIEEIDVMDMDGENPMSPASILNEFDKNYSYKLGTKTKVNGKNIQMVILKPNGASELKEIWVGIDVDQNLLNSYKMFGTNDVITEIEILEYKTNIELQKNTFVFDKTEWSGFELNN